MSVKRNQLKLVHSNQGLLGAAVEIARERRDTQLRLWEALERDDYKEAKVLARELIGHEKSDRTNQGVNPISGGGR